MGARQQAVPPEQAAALPFSSWRICRVRMRSPSSQTAWDASCRATADIVCPPGASRRSCLPVIFLALLFGPPWTVSSIFTPLGSRLPASFLEHGHRTSNQASPTSLSCQRASFLGNPARLIASVAELHPAPRPVRRHVLQTGPAKTGPRKRCSAVLKGAAPAEGGGFCGQGVHRRGSRPLVGGGWISGAVARLTPPRLLWYYAEV